MSGTFSSFFSKQLAPAAPSTPGYESALLRVANDARGMSSAYTPVVQQRMADLQDTTDEKRRARGLGAVDLAQSMGAQTYSEGNAAATPFARAMARAKALSRISLQGEMQVGNQALRDRMSMARLGNNVRNGVASDLNNLSAGQAQANASEMQAQQQKAATYANAGGAIAGGISSGISNVMGSKKK